MVFVNNGGKAYPVAQVSKSIFVSCKAKLTRPESNEESKPAEEKDSAVHVENIEDGDGPGLPVDRVDLRGRIQGLESDAHDCGCWAALSDG